MIEIDVSGLPDEALRVIARTYANLHRDAANPMMRDFYYAACVALTEEAERREELIARLDRQFSGDDDGIGAIMPEDGSGL